MVVSAEIAGGLLVVACVVWVPFLGWLRMRSRRQMFWAPGVVRSDTMLERELSRSRVLEGRATKASLIAFAVQTALSLLWVALFLGGFLVVVVWSDVRVLQIGIQTMLFYLVFRALGLADMMGLLAKTEQEYKDVLVGLSSEAENHDSVSSGPEQVGSVVKTGGFVLEHFGFAGWSIVAGALSLTIGFAITYGMSVAGIEKSFAYSWLLALIVLSVGVLGAGRFALHSGLGTRNPAVEAMSRWVVNRRIRERNEVGAHE